MKTISLQIPPSLQRALETCAQEDETTLDQIILSAVIEKISALQTQNYLEKRASRGNKKAVLEVLKKGPNDPPADYDT